MIWHASQRRQIEAFLQDNLSEWLRRQTRNLLGFARAGSNPAVVAFLSLIFILIHYHNSFLFQFSLFSYFITNNLQ